MHDKTWLWKCETATCSHTGWFIFLFTIAIVNIHWKITTELAGCEWTEMTWLTDNTKIEVVGRQLCFKGGDKEVMSLRLPRTSSKLNDIVFILRKRQDKSNCSLKLKLIYGFCLAHAHTTHTKGLCCIHFNLCIYVWCTLFLTIRYHTTVDWKVDRGP